VSLRGQLSHQAPRRWHA